MNKEKPYSPSSDPAALTGRRRRCRGPGRRWPRLRSRVAAAGRAPGRAWPRLAAPWPRALAAARLALATRARERERGFGGKLA